MLWSFNLFVLLDLAKTTRRFGTNHFPSTAKPFEPSHAPHCPRWARARVLPPQSFSKLETIDMLMGQIIASHKSPWVSCCFSCVLGPLGQYFVDPSRGPRLFLSAGRRIHSVPGDVSVPSLCRNVPAKAPRQTSCTKQELNCVIYNNSTKAKELPLATWNPLPSYQFFEVKDPVPICAEDCRKQECRLFSHHHAASNTTNIIQLFLRA